MLTTGRVKFDASFSLCPVIHPALNCFLVVALFLSSCHPNHDLSFKRLDTLLSADLRGLFSVVKKGQSTKQKWQSLFAFPRQWI